MRTIKTNIIQYSPTRDFDINLEDYAALLSNAGGAGINLCVLPELHNTPYFCQVEDVNNFDLAETIPGPTTERFGRIAREYQMVIVASLFERRAAGLYHNTAVVIDADGSLAGIYRKEHIPDDPGYYEKFYFTPGDLGFHTIKTAVGRLGVLVCWDQWFPEAARLMALEGAELLIYPTAIGWDTSDSAEQQAMQYDAWLTVQRGHAIANGLPLISVNRTGWEASPDGHGGIQFWGGSFVCGPQGELLLQTEHDAEGNFGVTIDLGRSEDVRRIWPFLRDRRIDHYGDLLKRYRF